MQELVAPNQSSFVPGHIINNIIIYQEVLNSMRKRRIGKGTMLIKVDLEKAYERIFWSCITNTLELAGLPSTWVRNVMHCVESTRMTIIWNGKNLDWFKPLRGIRQGDVISPYLFVLCMERLDLVINEAVESNRWKPVKVSCMGPNISHLFFVDDLLLFAEASKD